MAKVIKSPLPCSGRIPPKKREPPGTGFCPGCGQREPGLVKRHATHGYGAENCPGKSG